MVDVDKEMLVKALKGAVERVGKAAAQSTLKAAHDEMARSKNTFSLAGDRIIAAVCADVARVLKEEFATVETDLEKVRQFLEHRA